MSAPTDPVTSSTPAVSYTDSPVYIFSRDQCSTCHNLEPEVNDRVISGSTAIVSLFKDVADLLPREGPLCQVLKITRALNSVINQMQDDTNKSSCEYLVERVLGFLKNLVTDSKRVGTPLHDGTPAAAKLFVLLMYVILLLYKGYVSHALL